MAHKTIIGSVGDPGRTVTDDGWDTTGPMDIEAWTMANRLLSRYQTEFDGALIQLSVDWGKCIDRFTEDYNLHEQIYFPDKRDGKMLDDIINKFKQDPIDITIEVDSEKCKLGGVIAHSVAEVFLYDFFVIMNLSAPGSCHFGKCYIGHDNYNVDLNLNQYFFEIAFADGWEKWPSPMSISLDLVISWYFSNRNSQHQVPKNRMEKTLFAIMHICRTELSPAIIIWIFYALETFYDTKIGENFRVLVERICLLLSPNEKEKSSLKKNLRSLYDLRSSFVHGGMEVGHPMYDELIDKNVDGIYEKLMSATDYGFRLLLCSIQQVIKNGWQEPVFTEVLQGA